MFKRLSLTVAAATHVKAAFHPVRADDLDQVFGNEELQLEPEHSMEAGPPHADEQAIEDAAGTDEEGNGDGGGGSPRSGAMASAQAAKQAFVERGEKLDKLSKNTEGLHTAAQQYREATRAMRENAKKKASWF